MHEESTNTLLATARFKVIEHRYPARDGSLVTKATIQHPGAVAILPILPDGRICLIRNFRIAVGRELIELPAGTREPGEPPEVTAARELVEETGYQAGKITLLRTFQMSPGILNEQMSLFLAENLQPGKQQLEPHEHIEPLLVSVEEAEQLVDSGQIADAKTLVGLLHWLRKVRLPA